MSEQGIREHIALDCSNPGGHVGTLLEMLSERTADLAAARAETALLREAGDAMAFLFDHLATFTEQRVSDADVSLASKALERWRALATGADAAGEQGGLHD